MQRYDSLPFLPGTLVKRNNNDSRHKERTRLRKRHINPFDHFEAAHWSGATFSSDDTAVVLQVKDFFGAYGLSYDILLLVSNGVGWAHVNNVVELNT